MNSHRQLGTNLRDELLNGFFQEISQPSPAQDPFLQPTATPHIVPAPHLSLSPAEKSIIADMFMGYDRVLIEGEFTSGFSGCRVFWVQPIKGKMPELLTVIKMGPAFQIYKEWDTFETAVRGYWPRSVTAQDRPVHSADKQWAGLRYPLVGESQISDIQNLHEACMTVTLDAAKDILSHGLLPILDKVWQFSYPYPALPMRTSYDSVLPVNMIVQETAVPTNATVHHLSPHNLPTREIPVGDYVQLDHFVVSEINQERHCVTLNLPRQKEKPAASYRMRLQTSPARQHYHVGQQIDGLTGIILETRHQMLSSYVAQAWRNHSGLSATHINLDDGSVLPNPLAKLDDLLGRTPHVKVGHIHGDLHAANILLEKNKHNIYLIDFAHARVDHLLHDLICLETWVVSKILPELLNQLQLPAETICPIYRLLHKAVKDGCDKFDISKALPRGKRWQCRVSHRQQLSALQKTGVMLFTIRRMAQKYLFDPHDWREYDDGLTLYLLGAMKRKSLNQSVTGELPKRTVFLGAAFVQQLYEKSKLFRK